MTKLNISLLIFVLFFSIEAFCQTNINPGVKQSFLKNGIGLGSVIAVVASWERNKSILFAIIHGVLSWLYVIYFVFTRQINTEE
ncbi:hypothetical protein NF867_03930 [Solitalea sp. MAHUQ-68]|uniref:Uncharacterized protein n=1 Tax=Solitalea agri TaxID=2953739 RepID=A0A9X2F0V5_9SPHI|nr:hypothetical protein [Solitalea agri]MCO4292010.1 hypothetical protein [Solitalea agri]